MAALTRRQWAGIRRSKWADPKHYCCFIRLLEWRTEPDRCVWIECRHCGATSPAKHSYRLAWSRFKSVGFEGRSPGRHVSYSGTARRDDESCRAQ